MKTIPTQKVQSVKMGKATKSSTIVGMNIKKQERTVKRSISTTRRSSNSKGIMKYPLNAQRAIII